MGAILPIALGLLAAVLFGLNFYVQRQGLKTSDPLVGAFLSILSMAGMFWIFAPLSISPEWFSHPSIVYFILAGLIFPAIAHIFQIQAIGKVGPALTAAIGSLLPLFAAIPAVLFLGESFGAALVIGMALMMGGVVIAGLGGARVKRNFALWALLLPVASSAARGFALPLSKIGMIDIPCPFFATLVAGNVSAVVVFFILVGTGRAKSLVSLNISSLWFVLSGVINGTGILLVNIAISIGDITRVAPFISTVPLWVLFLGWAVFRVEKLGFRHVVIVALVMTGGILIATR